MIDITRESQRTLGVGGAGYEPPWWFQHRRKRDRTGAGAGLAEIAGRAFVFVKGAPERPLGMCAQQREGGSDAPLDTNYWRG